MSRNILSVYVLRLSDYAMNPQLLSYNFGLDVLAFSTTRSGGYSIGNYAEFNINRYCGDSLDAINQNNIALCAELGIVPDCLLMPHQVHLDKTVTIDTAFMQLSASDRLQALDGYDAIMTNLPGVCVGVSTADCIPILLYDAEHGAVCAVHAGWRGTVARIVRKAIVQMQQIYNSRPEQLVAQIGPGIHVESFEVGDEVYQAFYDAGFQMSVISRMERKWHIDLPLCNRMQLEASGVPSGYITVSPICTYQQSDRFFSARRLGINSGRIFTGIMLR